MKLSEKIFRDNLPSNSIVQSYKAQICNAIEEGIWETWAHCKEISIDETDVTDACKEFINKNVT